MKMKVNSKSSINKQTRHMNARYFFIKDRVRLVDMDIQHLPEEQMSYNYLAKLLQGHLFQQFR